MSDVDISMFKKKMPWSERVELIYEIFPSTAYLDWKKVFSDDPSVMGRIVNDILKAELSPGKPGKRPSLNNKAGRDQFKKIQDEDYSELPFNEALQVLKDSYNLSIRSLATKTGLHRSHLYTLLKGKSTPNIEVLEKVASSFNKHPSYFVEYRIGYILSMLAHRMMEVPESSIVQYNKIKGHHEKLKDKKV